MATYNGWTIVSMPASPAPKSIEPTYESIVGASLNPFTGQQQIHDWQAHYSELNITMPPLVESDGLAWAEFLMSCNGMANVFQLPAFWASLLPPGMAPGGYWRLKANPAKWSINEALIYGMQFDIREAI